MLDLFTSVLCGLRLWHGLTHLGEGGIQVMWLALGSFINTEFILDLNIRWASRSHCAFYRRPSEKVELGQRLTWLVVCGQPSLALPSTFSVFAVTPWQPPCKLPHTPLAFHCNPARED